MSRSRTAWRIAALALGLVAIGSAVVWAYRLELLTTVALRSLERDGLGPASLVLDRADLHTLHISDIALYGGAIKAAELTLDYSPFRLLARHLDRAQISGVRVALAADGDVITLGGRPLGTGGSTDAASPLGGVRIDVLKIDDAQIALERPGSPLTVAFSTELALAGAALSNASFSLDLAVPMGGATQAVRVTVPEFALSLQDGGALRLSFAGAELAPKDLPWVAEGVGGELVWRGGGATAKIAIDTVRSLRKPALIQPVRLAAEAGMAGPQIEFTVLAETEAAGNEGKLSAVVKGRYDRASETVQATVTAGPTMFRANGLQPHDLFPVLHGILSDVSGSLAVSGAAAWRDGALLPDLMLNLRDISIDSQVARLSRISGDIRFVRLWPAETWPHQVLTGIVEAGGLPPSRTTLTFRLLPTAALAIEALTADFVGGRISASPFTIAPARPQIDTVLGIEQVDLAELFKLIGIDGLSGMGRLDGHIGLRLRDGRVRVDDGVLAARGPGVLRFTSDKLPKEIGAAGAPMQLALEALADFHYEGLAVEIDQAASGEGTILLKFHGKNPAVRDGQPFNFNIKLESNFDRLTDLALRGMTAAQELLRRAVETTR